MVFHMTHVKDTRKYLLRYWHIAAYMWMPHISKYLNFPVAWITFSIISADFFSKFIYTCNRVGLLEYLSLTDIFVR